MKDRDDRRRDHDHRQREAEVKLHETHAIGIRLPGGGDEGDGAGLRRHDGKGHGVPRHGFSSEQVAVDGVAAARPVEAVSNDSEKSGD
jgi:hypothetical protein